MKNISRILSNLENEKCNPWHGKKKTLITGTKTATNLIGIKTTPWTYENFLNQ